MKKFKCSQETTGFLFCTDTFGNSAWDANGYYHRDYGFGMYLYCYMGMSQGRGYGTAKFKWGDVKQGIMFFKEYPHHLIII
jgi:hypothetical protein